MARVIAAIAHKHMSRFKKQNILTTVLVKRLSGSFHCTDLEFLLFDAEFSALFDGVIFKIDILQFFKLYPFFLNALGRTVANKITDSC